MTLQSPRVGQELCVFREQKEGQRAWTEASEGESVRMDPMTRDPCRIWWVWSLRNQRRVLKQKSEMMAEVFREWIVVNKSEIRGIHWDASVMVLVRNGGGSGWSGSRRNGEVWMIQSVFCRMWRSIGCEGSGKETIKGSGVYSQVGGGII